MRILVVLLALLLAVASTAAGQSPAPGHVHYVAPAQQEAAAGPLAPRLQNLGTHAFPVSTRNRDAQRFMNQGLNLA